MMAIWRSSSFIRFLMVGVLNTIVGLGLMYTMLALGVHYWPATLIGNTIGALVSYTLNRRFTFRSQARVASSFWKFIAITLCCYLLSYSIGLYGSQLLHHLFPAYPEHWVQRVAVLFGTGLYTITNYAGHKYISFRTKSVPEQ